MKFRLLFLFQLSTMPIFATDLMDAEIVNQRIRKALDSLRVYRIYSAQNGQEARFNHKIRRGSACSTAKLNKFPQIEIDMDVSGEIDDQHSTKNWVLEPDECLKASIHDLNNPHFSTALHCHPIRQICDCLVEDSDPESTEAPKSFNGTCVSSIGVLCTTDADCGEEGQVRCVEKVTKDKFQPHRNALGELYEYTEEEATNEERFCGYGNFGFVPPSKSANDIVADTPNESEDTSNCQKHQTTRHGLIPIAVLAMKLC